MSIHGYPVVGSSAPVATAPAPVPVSGASPARSLVTRRTQAFFEGTPGRFRLFATVGVLFCVAFGVVGFVTVSIRYSALAGARADAAQLVRIQTIRTSLVAADSNATNAFLVGGLEPAATARAYSAGISAASRTVATAAAADDRDAAPLRRVNDVISHYTGLVETARANNRQGFPIGAAYLRAATTELHADALPALASLVATERARVTEEYSRAHGALSPLVAVGIIAALVLLYVQARLSRLTRRTLNVSLALATVVLILGGGVTALVMATSQRDADTARSGPYTSAVALATMRMDAFDAKSYESLTLIARGSGQADETAFQSLAGTVKATIADHFSGHTTPDEGATVAAFDDYLDLHTQIRKDDDGGNWDTAVDLATGSKSTDANAIFGRFDTHSSSALAAQATHLSDDLSDARTPLALVRWLVLVAGLVAAGSCWRGIAIRLREYQ